ncbi:MAG: hypothetical protein RJA20_2751, partial [Bacteroidota bacterium]
MERIIQMAEKEQNARHDHTRELLEIEKKS